MHSTILGGPTLPSDSGGVERPIYFHSQKFIRAEANYTTTAGEGLAVVSSVSKYNLYVLVTKMVIRTDHNTLAFLFRSESLIGRIARWAYLLSEYDFKIVAR